jgi:acetyl esterase
VVVARDIPYADDGDRRHRLDVYRPEGEGPFPTVVYFHGGGFEILAKETHWLMGLAFARRGFLTLVPSYRLAPRHPFPAALRDACAAYRWAADAAAAFGADRNRVVLAGESAGANLALGLTLASCYRRPEPWAAEVFGLDAVPVALVSACGLLQVTDANRFVRMGACTPAIGEHIAGVGRAYLDTSGERERALADPLVVLEQSEKPERPLPACFAPVGECDPLLDDTSRLEAALSARGARCQVRIYPGQGHAFHAFVFREEARRCWLDCYAFLDAVLEASSRPAATAANISNMR